MEVLRQAAEHVLIEHNIRRITPEITAMMRAAMRDEKSTSAWARISTDIETPFAEAEEKEHF